MSLSNVGLLIPRYIGISMAILGYNWLAKGMLRANIQIPD